MENELDELELFDSTAHIAKCLKKWDKAVAKYPEAMRNTMAQILHNQWKVQERAAMKIRESATDQTTTTFGISVFPNSVVYPLVDQVFPNLIAMQICLVKPMLTSTANIYFKTRKFTTGGASFTHKSSSASTLEGGTVGQAQMVYTSETVTAEAMKLRAIYTSETVEDALRDGNVNFESDMVRDLAEEIIGEIDDCVLNDMFTNAGNSASYSTTVHSYETVKEHQQELWDSIVDANNANFIDMQRNSNFIVGDATSIGRLEKLQQFDFHNGAADDVFSLGSVRVGTLNNQYAVYKSTMAPASKLLVGIAKEGYMFCPYIPLMLTPTVYTSSVDEWSRGVRTRFGRKMIRANTLAVVTIS